MSKGVHFPGTQSACLVGTVPMSRVFRAVLFLSLAGALAACGSSSTTALSPSPLSGKCAVALDVSAASISAAGGSGVVRIQTNRECTWSLPPQPSWVKLTRPATPQGPAELEFVVAENRSTTLRSWEVVVADQRALVSQEAATCTWSLSPSKIAIDASGGEAQAVLTTEEFCSWELPAPASWIALTPDRGQGKAEITLRVSRNSGATRTEKVKVANAAIEVAQREAPPPAPAPPDKPAPRQPAPKPPSPPAPSPTEEPEPPAMPDPPPPTIPEAPPPPVPEPPPPPPPCTFALGKATYSDLPAAGSMLRVDVKTEATCSWTSQSAVEWITVPGDARRGTGAVDVKVSANPGPARSATIVVAGQSVSIQQRAIACTFAVTPGSFSAPATGGSVSVAVTAPAGCAWTVTGLPGWVTVSSSSGAGAAAISIAAAANTGAARSGALTIAGREFRLEQAAAPCAYSVTPDTFMLSHKKQNRKIQVATASHCEWTATGSARWVRVPPGTRTGSGEIEIKIEENSRSSERTAVVTIGGQNFRKDVTITQEEEDD